MRGPVSAILLILGLSTALIVMAGFVMFIRESTPTLQCMHKGRAEVCEEFLAHLNDAVAGSSKPLFVLTFGTLLGAIREGAVIASDDDVDLGVLPGCMPELIQLIHQKIPRAKVHKNLSGNFARVCYTSAEPGLGSIHVDMFAIGPQRGQQTTWKERNIPFQIANPKVKYMEDELFPIRTHTLSRRQFWVPHNAEAILERIYGDWMTPRQKKGYVSK